MKSYKIDLVTQTGKEKWSQIILDHKHIIKQIKSHFDVLVSSSSTSTGWVHTCLLWATKFASNVSPVLYKDEIECIANICEFTVEEVVWLQLCYELLANCTVAMFRIDNNNNNNNTEDVRMMRTMDWGLPLMDQLTIGLDVYANGILQYKSITFAGYLGIATAVKPGKYAVAINFRRLGNGPVGNAFRAATGKWPVGYLIREALARDLDAEQMREVLSESHLIAPCYYSLAIPNNNKSVVIARSPHETDNVTEMPSSGILVQANMDQFEGGKALDNILDSITRSRMAKSICKTWMIEKKLPSQQTCLKEFLQDPILNDQTVYACAIDVKSGNITTILIS